MTLIAESGVHAGQTIPCIFPRAGNRLRECYDLAGNVPEIFATVAGKHHNLANHRRDP